MRRRSSGTGRDPPRAPARRVPAARPGRRPRRRPRVLLRHAEPSRHDDRGGAATARPAARSSARPTRAGAGRERAIPESSGTVAPPASPAAATKVVDRTLYVHEPSLRIRARDFKHRRPVRAFAAAADQPVRSTLRSGRAATRSRATRRLCPTLVGATARLAAAAAYASEVLGASPKLRKPSARARPVHATGARPVDGERATRRGRRSASRRDGLRPRPRRLPHTGPPSSTQTRRRTTCRPIARIKKTQIAVRTPRGKPIVYGEVFDSGRPTSSRRGLLLAKWTAR